MSNSFTFIANVLNKQKIDNEYQYTILVDIENFLDPVNLVQKTVYASNFNLESGSLYLLTCILESNQTTKKMVINKVYSILPVSSVEQNSNSLEFSDLVKEVISNSSKFPVNLYDN